MKPTCFALVLLLTTPLFAANLPSISEKTSTNAGPTFSREGAESRVLKTYAVDDDAKFRAYAVMWHGHEVVVNDGQAWTNYREGDLIKIVVRKVSLKNETGLGSVLLGFDAPGKPVPVSITISTNALPIFNREIVESKVLKTYVVDEGDAKFRAYIVLWQGHEVVVEDNTARTNYHEGDLVRFGVRKFSVRERNGVGNDMFSFELAPTDSTSCPQRVFGTISGRPVRFECRGNELFAIEKDELDESCARVLATIGSKPSGPNEFLKIIEAAAPGNANYIVDPEGFMKMELRLKPRPNVHGERAADITKAESRFRKTLQRLNPQLDFLMLFVREDSVALADMAQQIAESAGLSTSRKLLTKDTPIVFGSGGQ